MIYKWYTGNERSSNTNHTKKQEWTQVIWRKVSSSCSTCDIRRVTLTLMEFDHWGCYIVLHTYQS